MERYKQLRTEYEVRQKYWNGQPVEGKIRGLLLENSHSPALRLFDVMETSFLPAVKSGDYELARTLLKGKIRGDYEAHRAAIDELVVLANNRGTEEEASASNVMSQRTFMLFGIQLAMLLPTLFIAWRFVRSMTSRLSRLSFAASRLTVGDIDGALKLLES